jgi:release factor glutamine methyltransferase
MLATESAGTTLIRFVESDLTDGLPFPDFPKLASTTSLHPRYSLIVSNPPYVPTATAAALLTDGRGEPLMALDGGVDGLDLIRALIANAIPVLSPRGKILIETGEYNAREAANCLRAKGFLDIMIHRDLEGQDRVVEGTLP